MTTTAEPGRRFPLIGGRGPALDEWTPRHPTLTEAELMAGYARGREPARSSAEDDLLTAIADALSLTGWTWQHVRRSDLAIVQGTPGFPDVLAFRDGVLLVIECKSETGRPTYEQVLWLRGFRDLMHTKVYPMIVRPSDLDRLLDGITGKAPEAFAELVASTWPPPPDRLQAIVDGLEA